MPKNKLQEVIFTILMVFVMVYAMVCYDITALNIWRYERRCFSGCVPRIADYDADCLYPRLFLSRKSGEKSSISHGRCKNRTSIPFDSRHLCGFCCMDVSADESGCYDFFCSGTRESKSSVCGCKQPSLIFQWLCAGSCSLLVHWCGLSSDGFSEKSNCSSSTANCRIK